MFYKNKVNSYLNVMTILKILFMIKVYQCVYIQMLRNAENFVCQGLKFTFIPCLLFLTILFFQYAV